MVGLLIRVVHALARSGPGERCRLVGKVQQATQRTAKAAPKGRRVRQPRSKELSIVAKSENWLRVWCFPCFGPRGGRCFRVSVLCRLSLSGPCFRVFVFWRTPPPPNTAGGRRRLTTSAPRSSRADGGFAHIRQAAVGDWRLPSKTAAAAARVGAAFADHARGGRHRRRGGWYRRRGRG